jgi:hypothetical protein
MKLLVTLSLAALLATAPASALTEIQEHPLDEYIEQTALEKEREEALYSLLKTALDHTLELYEESSNYREYLTRVGQISFFSLLSNERYGTINDGELTKIVRALGRASEQEERINQQLAKHGKVTIEKTLASPSTLCAGYTSIKECARLNYDTFSPLIDSSPSITKLDQMFGYCGYQQ